MPRRYRTSPPPNSLPNPHLGFDRHPGAQQVIFVFSRIEDDFYRDSLHNFYIVSSGILGRKQAEAGAAGAGDAIDLAIIFSAVRVNLNGDQLTYSHIAKLRLFEVGGYPNVIQRDQLHELLSRRDVLADFDGAVADNAI